jgi:hypothetical protein
LAAEAEDVASCSKALVAVAQRFDAATSQQPDPAARHQVLAAVLQQDAAFSVGILLSWALQRPQQLQLTEQQEWYGDIDTPEALLLRSSTLFEDLGDGLVGTAASDTARTLLQQLERSGNEAHHERLSTCAAAHLREQAAWNHAILAIANNVCCTTVCYVITK